MGGDLGKALLYGYVGQHYKLFTFFTILWGQVEYLDRYLGQVWLISDYEEVANIPVICEFKVSGLEMESRRGTAEIVELVTKKLRAVVDAAVEDEPDRRLTMLAYLGRVEE
jgi:hypothetical protein